jgi:tRNA modification GTPase
MSASDTIFALSSGPSKAGVAVIRLSGSGALAAVAAIAGRVPEPRRCVLATLRDPSTGESLDRGLAVVFPGPRSFTGEDVAELHVHGGRAVVRGVLQALGALDGMRPAEAGEFSRRAFLNGKLDLAEAEALADLIDAETSSQRRQALRGLDGGISATAKLWRNRLVEALALVEADIDFSDEGDVPDALLDPARLIASELERDIALALSDGHRGERLRSGFIVVLAGAPNAGKSTLLNRIARRDVAIVSPQAGTTRDTIEVHLDLDGYPVTLVDTAGLRDSQDPVELEGVRRARRSLEDADLVLWLVAPDVGAGELPEVPAPVWVVATKADLDSDPQPNARFRISASTGSGLAPLLDALAQEAREQLSASVDPMITRERHRKALAEAQAALAAVAIGAEPEIVAEELRLASRALGRIAGRVDVEDILDAVFSRFCIGK